MKKYDFIVWDFNGTIIDDVQIGIESINVLLSRRGLMTINSREAYQNSFCFPIVDWYRSLGFDFEIEDYTDVANEWVKEYLKREDTAPLGAEVVELLERFAEMRIDQVIVSASEENMLKRQLTKLGIEGYFEAVVGKNDVYASGKIETAKAWRKSNPGEILFIGDTDHDLEVAKSIGADCILTASGHQSYERLTSLSCEDVGVFEVVRGLHEIVRML